MKKLYFYFFIVLVLGYCSCNLSRNIIDPRIITESYNYIELTDTFQLKIIMYMPCGSIRRSPCADFFIGINDKNDTIRVISTYNMLDTIYQYNDEVWIIPESKPNNPVITSICVNPINRKKWELCEWQTNKYYKTIYGKIVK